MLIELLWALGVLVSVLTNHPRVAQWAAVLGAVVALPFLCRYVRTEWQMGSCTRAVIGIWGYSVFVVMFSSVFWGGYPLAVPVLISVIAVLSVLCVFACLLCMLGGLRKR